MALSYASTETIFRASYSFVVTKATFDSSYATSGETVLASSFGLREIAFIIPGTAQGFTVEPVKTNPGSWLLKAYAVSASTNTVTEFASALDRSALVVDLLIIGR